MINAKSYVYEWAWIWAVVVKKTAEFSREMGFSYQEYLSLYTVTPKDKIYTILNRVLLQTYLKAV